MPLVAFAGTEDAQFVPLLQFNTHMFDTRLTSRSVHTVPRNSRSTPRRPEPCNIEGRYPDSYWGVCAVVSVVVRAKFSAYETGTHISLQLQQPNEPGGMEHAYALQDEDTGVCLVAQRRRGVEDIGHEVLAARHIDPNARHI